MKPETILKTDLLDIIFDNRNKDYGAYILRSQYNNRLSKAVLITFGVAILFSFTLYLQVHYFKTADRILPPEVIELILSGIEKNDKPKPVEQKQISAKQKVNQVANPTYVIVPDEQADKRINNNKDLEKAQIGIVNVTGVGDTDYYQQQGSIGLDTGTIAPPQPPVVKEVTEPFEKAEFMPEFPGGNDELTKYMLRNLKEVDDLEEGKKVVIHAKFVVENDGKIDRLEILNKSSRYDADVLRVIKKMPKWKPGLQNGISVPVYLTLPITFQGKE